MHDDIAGNLTTLDISPIVKIFPNIFGDAFTFQLSGQVAMDLKEQLVVWKKSSYLLDHVTLSPRLCEGLVDEGLFNADMMNEVYVSTRISYASMNPKCVHSFF